MNGLATKLGDTWVVALISATMWGGGFWLQREYERRRSRRDTVKCSGRLCRILGVRPGEHTLHVYPAIGQVFGMLYLVAGLIEAWCCGTFRTLAVLGNAFVVAMIGWRLVGSRISRRTGN